MGTGRVLYRVLNLRARLRLIYGIIYNIPVKRPYEPIISHILYNYQIVMDLEVNLDLDLEVNLDLDLDLDLDPDWS